MRISILLPVYNAADTIGAAVESMLQQDAADFELIVVDDGSTDGTSRVLDQLAPAKVATATGAPNAHADSGARAGAARSVAPRSGAARSVAPRADSLPITVIRTAHRGLVPALTAGWEASRGDYIARMDADDTCRPSRLRLQADFLDSHPDIGVVGTAATMPSNGANEGYRRYTEWVNGLNHWRQIRRAQFIESPLIHPTVMFRREVMERCGGYREGPFPEDYELWLRWFAQGVRAAAIPQRLLTWNDPPDRVSRTPAAVQSRDSFYRVKGSYLARAVDERRRGRPILIWGAGRRTRRRMEAFGQSLSTPIQAFIDFHAGTARFLQETHPILAPDRVPSPQEAYIVAAVGSRGVRGEIGAFLARRGYRYEQDWIAAG